MTLINGDPISLLLTAAVVGIGAGIGSAVGQAIYRAFLEDRVQRFLDKKHHEETLKNIKENIVKIKSDDIVEKMLK